MSERNVFSILHSEIGVRYYIHYYNSVTSIDELYVAEEARLITGIRIPVSTINLYKPSNDRVSYIRYKTIMFYEF